jgi:uncharacterized membrane protein (DUF441 family)
MDLKTIGVFIVQAIAVAFLSGSTGIQYGTTQGTVSGEKMCGTALQAAVMEYAQCTSELRTCEDSD